MQKISNSEHHIEQLKEEIENIENLHQDQEKAKEVYIAFKQNKSDLEELESILSEKEFIMKAYKGVSTEEGERRVEEMGGVRNTVAGLKEMHLEISKRFNKWGAEIATMSRRDYLKVSGLIAGGFATGTYGAFTAENIWDQIESGQFQPFEFVSAAHHKSIEKAVRGETVPVYLIQILFDEADNISLNWRGIIESAEREFERSLDIDLNIEYLSLELDLDKLIVTNPGERWRQQQRELKEVILEGDVNEGAESAEVSGGDVSKTHQYVLGQLGNYKPVRELPDDAIIAAFSDFARGGGVATVRPENGILMNNYGNQISFRDTFVHEIGHKFGLPHAAVAPHDVMSYSEIRDYSNELGEERGFTFESKFNWSRAKRKVRE